ncbi:MAG: 16S rRNA (cytidine(1402)-2'-O)-methyltransferase [Patescibacteria group bacterium]
MKEGMLYVVATPIGNLEDISLRALRILKEVDMIACEDTRVTKKLLHHFKISTPTISYFQHSSQAKIQLIINRLNLGKNIALVTDSGTPGISDPGNILVKNALENEIRVVPVPGASAITAIISISGINMQKFSFFAFPPHKKGREKFFKKIAESEYPAIYYDSSHRLMKNLSLIYKFCPTKKIIIARELTKIFEEVIRGNIKDVLTYFKNKDKLRGEFVIILY